MADRSRPTIAIAAVAAAVLAAFILWPRDESATERPAVAPAPADAGPAVPPPVAVPPERIPEGAEDASKAAAPGTPPSAPGSRAETSPLRIHGRLVSRGGAAVPGAEVEVRAWSGTDAGTKWSIFKVSSGADGAFDVSIDRALATRGFGVATTAEGFVEGWRAVKAGEYDEGVGVEIVLEGARAIVGRVVDEYGRPVPETIVQLWYGSDTTWPTAVDADGRFRTPRHAPTTALDLIVETPGYPRRSVPVGASADDPTDLGDLVFRRGGAIAGVVVDREGVPVPDLALVVLGVAGPPARAPRTKTDGGGRFEFAGLGEGTVSICVDGAAGDGGAPGARRSYRGDSGEVAVGSTDLRLVVRTETTVVLRFVDASSGEPVDVRKVEYGFREEGAPEPANLGQGASSSAPLLTTRLTVWPGRYDFSARAPGFEPCRIQGVEVQDRAEFTLDVPIRRSP